MANGTGDWFLGERSEAMATLLLRSRDDIRVRDESRGDNGADFLVDANRGEPHRSMPFLVEVKGTTSSDQKKWPEIANPLFQLDDEKPGTIPVCLFLFNVRENIGYFAWIAEPVVEQNNAVMLHFTPEPNFHELDESAVDGIIARVRDWYAAVPKQSVRKGA